MTVRRDKDTRTPRVLMHKVADIRGGVSVNVSELGGDYLREGAFLSAPVDGICHVVKTATVSADVAEAEAEKTVKVEKLHNFKSGDFVMAKVGGVAVKIASIDTSNKAYDVLTLSAALGAVSKGSQIAEAKEAAAQNTSALKYQPLSVVGTGKPIDPKSNLDTDAWVIAVTHGNPIPEFMADALKGIINY